MAICLTYQTPYDGVFKYDIEMAKRLVPRLESLLHLFPRCRHTGRKQSRYDFTAVSDDQRHLSAKSTKKGGKVAPQVIGQSTPRRFCELLGLSEFSDITELKKYIQENIVDILPVLSSYTFDCPTVYYHQERDTIDFIQLHQEIPWKDYTFEWTSSWDKWNNSSTMKLKPKKGPSISLLEIQFHTKSRKNMAIRWCYENVLQTFSEHFNIKTL